MANDKHAVNDDPPTPPDIEWTAMTRAAAQVVLGNLMIIAGVGSIVFFCYLGTVSTGIWVGAMVLATGLVGVIDAARYSYSVRKAYVNMLIACTILSLIMVAVEVTAYLVERQPCDIPAAFVGNDAVGNWTTSRPHPPGCDMECVYADEALVAFGVLDFVGAAVCIYYSGSYLRRRAMEKSSEPIPYESMKC